MSPIRTVQGNTWARCRLPATPSHLTGSLPQAGALPASCPVVALRWDGGGLSLKQPV